jgi:hypothetical protein
MAIKEVRDKDLEYAKATPGSPDEEANLLPKIVREFGKARNKLGGISNWLAASIGDPKLIELGRKGGKPSSKAPVVFALVFDKTGLRLDAQTATGDYSCSNLVTPPSSVSDQRDFLKDLHKFDGELVTDDELSAFNKANPTAELKALYALRDSEYFKATSFLKMKGDSLKLFRTWIDKNDKQALKDADYITKNSRNPPAAVVKRVDDVLKAYNAKRLGEIKADIKKAEDAL